MGKCSGDCVAFGDEIPRNGECVGEIPIKGAPEICSAERTGICPNGVWAGSCAASFDILHWQLRRHLRGPVQPRPHQRRARGGCRR